MAADTSKERREKIEAAMEFAKNYKNPVTRMIMLENKLSKMGYVICAKEDLEFIENKKEGM